MPVKMFKEPKRLEKGKLLQMDLIKWSSKQVNKIVEVS